jgi:uncharacterized tellurite resistance protein B-like protein
MNLKDFTEPQRQALLDLALLAMYADGHLATAEDERVQRLLTAMGFSTDYERGQHYDAAVSRVRSHSSTAAAARTHATALAQNFASKEQRQRVHDVLDDLMSSDSRVAPQESTLLGVVKEALHL